MLAMTILERALQAQQQVPMPTNTGDFLTTWLGYGIAGVLFLMVILKIKIQPTYVFDEAKAEWERERTRLELENAELKEAAKESVAVYTKDVVPMMTLVVERMHDWITVIEKLEQPQGRE